MARRSSIDRTEHPFRFVPIGLKGLDRTTSPILLPQDRVPEAWNVRPSDALWRRRKGRKRLAILTDPVSTTGSKVFAAITKYGTIPASTELLIAKGGFAVIIHVNATRPASTKTAYIISNRQNGQTYGVVWFTLSDAGVPTAHVRWASGSTSSVAGSAVTADGPVSLLLVFDAELGTLTLYQDGDLVGTPASGIASTDQPAQVATPWYVGVEYDPAVPGVTADTHFSGAVDSFTGLSLRGQRVSKGSAPLLTALRKWSLQEFPNPQSSMVLWHYGFDESSGAVMTDSSRHKNHGVYTSGGDAPANAANVAHPFYGPNFVGVIQSPNGTRTNVVAAGGQLFSETVRGST